MFGIVRKDGNNNKYIHPLTSDVGAGAPVGSLAMMYKKSAPDGYLYCDGSTFDSAQYPALYMYLGTDVLPDKDTGRQTGDPYYYIKATSGLAENQQENVLNTAKDYIDGLFPDWSQVIQSGITADGYTPQEDCYAVLRYITVRSADVSIQLKIDNNVVSTNDNSSMTISGTTYKINIVSWAGYIKAGSEVKWLFDNAATALGGITFFKLTRTTS